MKQLLLVLLAATTLVTASAACSDDGENPDGDSDGNDGDPPKPKYTTAKGVTIKQVAIYQSLKRTLMIDGAPGDASIPLIPGRDAVVRVFYETNGDFDGKEVLGRLHIEGGDPIEVTGSLVGPSSDGDINSTLNFIVPGDRVGATLEYAVSILQEGEGEGNAAARHPAEGNEVVTVEGPPNKLRVILAPFRYDYDGSGRLPDLSPEGVERYRTRLKQLYPVSDVEVTVREPVPWDNRIDGDGTGWQEVGFEVYGMRGQDGASDDVYYYGVFQPTDSFNEYCGGGCLLGVTLLNNQPPDTGSIDLRLALGVGYEQYAHDTCAHELGHAHGREHAPCGPGLDPQSIDSSYPHQGGQIGVWGLDTASLTLYPPDQFTDVMGYCNNTWISDHNYKALLARGQNVNLPKWHAPVRKQAIMVSIDGSGAAQWAGLTTLSENVRGRSVAVQLESTKGTRVAAEGHYFAWDHLPGGWMIVPTTDPEVARVHFDLDGAVLTANR